jgi:hypothetical protein
MLICSVCKNSFNILDNFFTHIRTIHKDATSLQCPFGCFKVYSYFSSLRYHVYNVHFKDSNLSIETDNVELECSRPNEITNDSVITQPVENFRFSTVQLMEPISDNNANESYDIKIEIETIALNLYSNPSIPRTVAEQTLSDFRIILINLIENIGCDFIHKQQFNFLISEYRFFRHFSVLSHSLQKCVPNLNQIAKKCDF